MVCCLFLQFYMVMILEWLKVHKSIVYFDSLTHFMVLECLKIHSSIAVLLLHCYELVL